MDRLDVPNILFQDCLPLELRNKIEYNLRVKEFVIPRINSTSYGKHSVRYFGPLLWSKLDASLRNAPSVKTFKNEIRKRDLEQLLDACGTNCRLCTS